ncbi:MAG TPA: hypothetical protein VGO56_22165 [Pyrinomonadaceae bacterium]|jgi:hypothetical protein|nr:hypothetical protein [Pyrinomonadaceae bacterium]
MDSLSGFTSATDLAKQLITLATGILALSITFIKDVVKSNGQVVTWPLKASWIAYLLSICFGMWNMMAITGSIFHAIEHPSEVTTYGPNIAIPALMQILAFLSATIFLIWYGAKMLRLRASVVGATLAGVAPVKTQD